MAREKKADEGVITEDFLKALRAERDAASDADKPALTGIERLCESILQAREYAKKGLAPLA